MRLAVFVLVALIACGKKTNESAPAAGSATTAPAPSPSPEPSPVKPVAPSGAPTITPLKAAPGDVLLEKMIGFRDRACACKDQACLDAVRDDMNKMSNEQTMDPAPPVMTDAHSDGMLTAATETTGCMERVINALP